MSSGDVAYERAREIDSTVADRHGANRFVVAIVQKEVDLRSDVVSAARISSTEMMQSFYLSQDIRRDEDLQCEGAVAIIRDPIRSNKSLSQ